MRCFSYRLDLGGPKRLHHMLLRYHSMDEVTFEVLARRDAQNAWSCDVQGFVCSPSVFFCYFDSRLEVRQVMINIWILADAHVCIKGLSLHSSPSCQQIEKDSLLQAPSSDFIPPYSCCLVQSRGLQPAAEELPQHILLPAPLQSTNPENLRQAKDSNSASSAASDTVIKINPESRQTISQAPSHSRSSSMSTNSSWKHASGVTVDVDGRLQTQGAQVSAKKSASQTRQKLPSRTLAKPVDPAPTKDSYPILTLSSASRWMKVIRTSEGWITLQRRRPYLQVPSRSTVTTSCADWRLLGPRRPASRWLQPTLGSYPSTRLLPCTRMKIRELQHALVSSL